MKLELESLVRELERQKETRKDVVVDTTGVYMTTEGKMSIGLVENEVTPQVYELTDWAHQQVAEKLGIPIRYYRRMLEEDTQLLSQNVNTWIGGKGRLLLRILDNNIRAVLSDRYKVMNNEDLLFCALEQVKDLNSEVQVYQCVLTDTRMFIKMVQPYEEREIVEDDKVIPGIMLSNGEVGAGRFMVEPFLLRLVCSNGLIGEHVLSRFHIGERRDVGIWSDETLRKSDELLWAEVRDVIRSAFDPVIFDSWVKKLSEGVRFSSKSS